MDRGHSSGTAFGGCPLRGHAFFIALRSSLRSGARLYVMVGPVQSVSVIGSDTSVGEAVAARLVARDMRLVPVGQSADALVCSDPDGQVDLARTRGAIRSATTTRVVYASTAMVYGAWPNNPVPLTE